MKAAIIGANGYTGLELLQILLSHPACEVTHAVSRSNAGVRLSEMYPSLFAYGDMAFEELDVDKIAADCDVVFTALPHAASAEVGGQFYDRGKYVIDLSADYRYRDIDVYESWYKVRHPRRDLAALSVYGLPEINRDAIKSARLVGNPGCYTTCTILSLYPLLAERLIETKNIIVDAKSGTTGAGRKADVAYAFTEVNENFRAYGVTTHRHTSEIEEVLSAAAGEPILLSFTPHLLPVQRGIYATSYANLAPGVTEDDLYAAYDKFYGKEYFAHIVKGVPSLSMVRHSNHFAAGFVVDKRLRRVVVCGVIDNLVKGASGQAVQNMNLLFGLPEQTGLDTPPKYL